jgi:hypothetical protein
LRKAGPTLPAIRSPGEDVQTSSDSREEGMRKVNRALKQLMGVDGQALQWQGLETGYKGNVDCSSTSGEKIENHIFLSSHIHEAHMASVVSYECRIYTHQFVKGTHWEAKKFGSTPIEEDRKDLIHQRFNPEIDSAQGNRPNKF